MKILWVALLFISVQAKAENVVVEAIGGSDVSVTLAGKQHNAQAKENISNGDKLETGKASSLDLRFPDNSLVRLGISTSAELTDNSIRLNSGSIRVLVPENRVKSKSGIIRFRLSTPEGTVGVRGTEFVVDRSKDATTVHTLRGDVLFGPVNDFSDLSKFHIVTKGYESTIKVGEHEVSSPKQFPLDEYLKSINSQIFSPLATRESGAFAPRSANNLSSPLKVSPSKENAIAARKKESSSKESTAGEPNAATDPNELFLSAAAQGNVEQLKAALQAGADPQKALLSDTKDTALHVAAVSEQLAAVQFLLDDVHMSVDLPNAKGQTALMRAAQESTGQDVVLLLLQNGASKSVKDANGITALGYAKMNKNTNAIFSLLNGRKSK